MMMLGVIHPFAEKRREGYNESQESPKARFIEFANAFLPSAELLTVHTPLHIKDEQLRVWRTCVCISSTHMSPRVAVHACNPSAWGRRVLRQEGH